MSPKPLLILAALMAVFPWASLASAQQADNIGLYEFLYTDGVYDYWGRIWSAYIPDVENEPLQPGDSPAYYYGPSYGGPWCDPDTNICYDPLSTEARSSSQPTDLPPRELPDIVVTPLDRLARQALIHFLDELMLQIGSGFSDGVARIDPGIEDEPAEPCEDSDLDALRSALSDDQVEAIKGFLNSAAMKALWNDSLPSSAVKGVRLEQGGYLLPDGSGGYNFRRAVADPGPNELGITEQTSCSIEMDLPIVHGAIPVHTHPFTDGEEWACMRGGVGDQYESGPSGPDRAKLAVPVLTYGIVVDADKIYVYARHQSDDVTDGIERCGY